MMWEAAAAKIKEQGGQILMGRELVGLAYDEPAKLWRIEVATADGNTRKLHRAQHREFGAGARADADSSRQNRSRCCMRASCAIAIFSPSR